MKPREWKIGGSNEDEPLKVFEIHQGQKSRVFGMNRFVTLVEKQAYQEAVDALKWAKETVLTNFECKCEASDDTKPHKLCGNHAAGIKLHTTLKKLGEL